VRSLADARWIERAPVASLPPRIADWRLGRGESAVLAVAHAGRGVAIVDDREARRCAGALGVPAFGTLGVVLRAKRAGTVPLARPVLEELVHAGMWLNEATVIEALRSVGE
jgi:predicted nucleic acid-binding protein